MMLLAGNFQTKVSEMQRQLLAKNDRWKKFFLLPEIYLTKLQRFQGIYKINT